MERIMLVSSDGEEGDNNNAGGDDEDDLYKGYNEFHPILDTRNIQDDELFRETVQKSSQGRTGGGGGGKQRPIPNTNSTAGMAFNRETALRSRRRTGASRGTGGGGGGNNRLITAGTRPLTAVRGAGYTSGGGGGTTGGDGIFDPLGLAQTSTGTTGGEKYSNKFRLQDETSKPEYKIRMLETQINQLLDESVLAATGRRDYAVALELAKDCVAKERSLNRMKEQSGLTEQFGTNTDLTFAVMFNLAEQYRNAKMWPEAINTYQSLVKNRGSFTNTGRLRMNIGEICYHQGQYPKAIKFFRMALDQVHATQSELRLKLMQNIGLSFVRLQQFADAIASFEYIASERGDLDAQTAFHLIICYYAMGDTDKMKYYYIKLLQVKVEDQFEERYGHHEILTNGGNIFAGGGGGGASSSSIGGDRSTPTGGDITGGGVGGGSGNITGPRSSSPILLIRDEQDHNQNLLLEAIRSDRLRQYEKRKIQHVEWCILTAAKLIAPMIEQQQLQSATTNQNSMNDISSTANFNSNNPNKTKMFGYEWCLEQIRRISFHANDGGSSMIHPLNGSIGTTTTPNSNGGSSGNVIQGNNAINYTNLADELELYKAVKHLRAREFDAAIFTLKMFEKRDKLSTSSAMINVGGGGGGGMSMSRRTISSAGATIGSNSNSTMSTTIGTPVPAGAAAISTTPTSSQLNNQYHQYHHYRHFGTTSSLSSSAAITGHSRVASTAATNLAFLYILQNELDIAGRYADEAITIDRYAIGALLNRGTVCFYQGDYSHAADYYREVINTSSNCLEAYYNLALVERKMENFDKALECMFRLRTLTKNPMNTQQQSQQQQQQQQSQQLNQKISNTIEINLLYQIGSIYETMGNLDQATDFYQQILTYIPTDVSLLVKMADIATDSGDRNAALNYLNESYRYLPSHIPTIERLAAYHIEIKMYEKAIKYLEQLAKIQPTQIKWQLMIAASYRRAGNYQQAFSQYQSIHARFPDNMDCLKFLIRICNDLDSTEGGGRSTGGKSYAQLADQYSDQLRRMEKAKELREHQTMAQQQFSSRSASRASAASSVGNGGRASAAYSSINRTSASSREGSAATTSTSSGGSSSGYLTSGTGGGVGRGGGGGSFNKGTTTTKGFNITSGSSSNSSFDPINGGINGNGPTSSPSPSLMNRTTISAIVDQVVEELDNGMLNERPMTSWTSRTQRSIQSGKQHQLPSTPGGVNGGNGGIVVSNADLIDEDELLDANLDDILPD